MDTKLPSGFRTRRFAVLVACACWLAGPFTSHAQVASFSFSPSADSPLAVGRRPTTPVIADVNGDGRADIVVALESDHAVAVLLGRPQGGFQPAPGSPFSAGDSPFSIDVADLDGDSKLDVVAANRLSHRLTVLRGDGLGGFRALGDTVPTGKEPRSVRIADMNRDGKPDLAVANYRDKSVSILLGDGSGAFAPAVGSPIAVGRNPWGLTVADFNGDGAPDFAVANPGDDSVSVLLNNGNAGFTATGSPIRVGSAPIDVTSADLNHDGKMDLVSADTWSHTVTPFLGDGTGSFTHYGGGGIPVNGGYPRMVVVADLDLDGYPDLVTANENSSISLLAGLGENAFLPIRSSLLEQPNILNTVAVGDLNGDGAPDIVGCGPDFGLTIWLNTLEAFVVSAPPVRESDLVAKVTLRRTFDLTRPLSFLVSTRDDTAKADRDYTPVQLQATFEPNQTEIVVSIPLINDDFGKDTRQFLLEFSEPNPIVRLPSAVPVVVRDDDELVTIVAEVGGAGLHVNLDTGQYEFPEGTGPIRFTARRRGSLDSTRHFLVHYRLEGRAITRNEFGINVKEAVPGTDFVVPATEGVFEFGPGVTERSIEVTLPGDTVPRGYRGIAFHLSYKDVGGGEESEVVAFLRDDEHMLLRQQMFLDPYLPAGEPGNNPIHELPDGKILVLLGPTVLQLTRDGLPDLSFGRGTGRALLASILSPGEELSVDRVLLDGRLQLRTSGGNLVRLTADGIPDPSFGNGTGVLPFSFKQLLDTAPDGGLIIVDLEDQLHLRRLLPDGSRDTEFSSGWSATEGIVWARVSPQGQIWVVTFAGELVRLGPNGELDLGFAPRRGMAVFSRGGLRDSWSPGYFDVEGRAYFHINDSLEFGDPTQGAIVRFREDGRYDEAYRPVASGSDARVLELEPNGTMLALINERELVQVDPTGHVRTLHQATDPIGRANWSSGRAILLSSVSCRGWPLGGCAELNIRILAADGATEQLGGSPLQEVNLGLSPWYTEYWNSGSRLNRADTYPGGSRVGLAHSGRYALESSASVQIQRSGTTANAATVRGRVFPLVAGQWDASAAQSFEVEFPVGHADVELVLPHVVQPGRQSLREFLVRLESATGVELSDFTACRLWVVDDETLPSPGELALERFVGKDEQNLALLMGRPVPGKNLHRFEFRSRFDLPLFYEWFGTPTLGPAWTRPVQTDGYPTGFFRMVTE